MMEEWKKWKFSEFVDINPSVKLKIGEEHSFVEMKDLDPSSRRVNPSAIKVLKGGSKFQNYDTLFARITPCLENGKISQVCDLKNGVGFGSTELLVMRGIKNLSDSNFIYYLCRSPFVRKFAEAKMIGTSGRQRVPKEAFDNLIISTPPLKEQQAIASILSSLDDKIELNLQMNKTLEGMAMTLYKVWFVGFDSDSIIKISELIELNPKLQLRKGTVASYVEMKALPVDAMSVSDVVKKEFNGGSKFQNGDTLLARITPCLENGKTAFVDFLNDEEIAFGSTEFITMRAKGNVSPYWVYCLARDPNFRKHAISTMVGSSGRQRVQEGPLLNYEVTNASTEKMNAFHSEVENWFKLIRSNTKENIYLTQTRDTLLPKLISGEIRVKDIEKEIAEVL